MITKQKIERAQTFAHRGYMKSKVSWGIAEGEQPRAGFDAAQIQLARAARTRGAARNIALRDAIEELVRVAQAVKGKDALRYLLRETFNSLILR